MMCIEIPGGTAKLSSKRYVEKLVINETAIYNDLENNWAVVAEAIQTILRRENYPKPYEALKEINERQWYD